MLQDAVEETIRRHRMLDPGDHVLIAVSGGVDSVVLLDLLRRTARGRDLTLTVAHLNHRWRGAASDADARFIESLAASAGLPIVLDAVSDEAIAMHSGLGREGAAREVRRAFLRKAADDVGASRIALGHTANDRAETILFNLTRGAGTAGVAGIAPTDGPVVRPLIEVEREAVVAHAERVGLAWREDASNADLSFARNRIRHRVLPELERINPRAVEAIGRAGDLAGDAERIAAVLVERLWPELTIEERPEEIRIDRSGLTALPAAVRRLVLREGGRRVRGDLAGIEHAHLVAAEDLVASPSAHGRLDLPRLHVRVDRDAVFFAPATPTPTPAWAFPVETGRTEFAHEGFALDLRLIEASDDRPRIEPDDETVEVADADRVVFPLSVRNRRDGDRFTPLGLDRPIKLKDFLINERVPFFDRDRVPLLCDRERIVWVAGVRLSNDVRVSDATGRRLVMRLEALR